MIGIDIVDIARISGLIERHGAHFLEKVFVSDEILVRATPRRMAESLAGKFAAKEAFMKARGRRLDFREIAVLNESGRPYIVYKGTRYDSVSISHERSYAVSVVILNDEEGGRQ